MWSEIGQFRQLVFELFYEAWKRFRELLKRCPQHDYQNWMQTEIFYNISNGHTGIEVKAAVGGTLITKTTDVAFSLLEKKVT